MGFLALEGLLRVEMGSQHLKALQKIQICHCRIWIPLSCRRWEQNCSTKLKICIILRHNFSTKTFADKYKQSLTDMNSLQPAHREQTDEIKLPDQQWRQVTEYFNNADQQIICIYYKLANKSMWKKIVMSFLSCSCVNHVLSASNCVQVQMTQSLLPSNGSNAPFCAAMSGKSQQVGLSY